jgi:pSer/pThr/pTyr-binding forkhead associated (FHA) protein
MENQSQVKLVVREGPNPGHAFALVGSVVTMGRASDNTLVFDSSRVSRHHAQIRFSPSGKAVIEDLGSTNGTWLNERQLAEPQRLSSGDMIRLADYVTLEYVAEQWGPTEKLDLTAQGSATQVMQDESESWEPGGDAYERPDVEPYTPPQPARPAYQEAAAYEHGDDDMISAPSSAVSLEAEADRSGGRPRWVVIVIGLLVVAICLCVAAGIYLWFAPVTFWERVFDLFGIPMPSGYVGWTALSLWL